MLEPNPSGDPVGSTGSQRLFRSGVPTIGGELGSSGVSCVAPFVKEALGCPRSGQMSNPVGNRLSVLYLRAYAHIHNVPTLTCLRLSMFTDQQSLFSLNIPSFALFSSKISPSNNRINHIPAIAPIFHPLLSSPPKYFHIRAIAPIFHPLLSSPPK